MLSCFAKRKYQVAPFKVGPDFIDPGHHTKIVGRISYNLDSWMLSRAYNKDLFQKKASDADIAVIEGVMGLFDGYDGLSEAGSTAQMAKWLNLPVILIVNAKGTARSAAAIVKGFEAFDKDLNICGVIFTQTGSRRHYKYLKKAVMQNCNTPCLGHFPKNDAVKMPERHLGLVTAQERVVSEDKLFVLRDMVETHIDIPALINRIVPVNFEKQKAKKVSDDFRQGPAIAVARDAAFCFYYPDNFEILENAGAKIVEFSPIKDVRLPDDIDGIYLGGGYPEVFAEGLSKNSSLLADIKKKSDDHMPIYGECGGFMFLCSALSGMDDSQMYTMTGCFDFNVQMSKRLRSLGYREITLMQDTVIGKKGDVIRGHEFHYSALENDHDQKSVYQVTSRSGQQISLKGYQKKQTLGSYLHIHFGSNPSCAGYFVDTCLKYKESKY